MDLPGFVPNNTNLGGEYPKKSIWMDTRVTRTTFQVCPTVWFEIFFNSSFWDPGKILVVKLPVSQFLAVRFGNLLILGSAFRLFQNC
jgi:hypothetical protein